MQQNCALRAVMKVDPYYPAENIRQELGFDNVVLLMRKASCKFAYKGFYDLGPPALNAMFEVYICDRDVRSSEQLRAVVPRCRTQFGERNFAIRAVVYWNGLPVNCRMATSAASFKGMLKDLADI